jgi:hypothetical protein
MSNFKADSATACGISSSVISLSRKVKSSASKHSDCMKHNFYFQQFNASVIASVFAKPINRSIRPFADQNINKFFNDADSPNLLATMTSTT